MDEHDAVTTKALLRYQIISAYLAQDPPRGQRRILLEKLAARSWMLETGEVFRVKAETLRYWLRRYRQGGFEALKDNPRPRGRNQAIPQEVIETACRLKREVPERTIERIIVIMESMQLAPPGLLRRSTLHRALKKRGLSERKLRIADNKDLDRFQADYANDLWQSDMLKGPWLPDPGRPGKMRRAHLYAFLDDASRLLLYGRFFFKGDLPALELVFKRSLQRYGRPVRVYYDNAKVYRANHMRLICAELGIHRPIYTRPYRPMGHGKIEAFNRFCITNFIAEVKASAIRTLDQLNEAFLAWVDEEYNQRRHGALGTSPRQRWLKDASRIQYLDEEKIRVAFLWREIRRVDKTSVVSLFNRKYKVSAALSQKSVEIRYDPERLDRIEIYIDGSFRQRAKRLQIKPDRAPKELLPEPARVPEKPTDYLGYLTQKRQSDISEVAKFSKKTASKAFLNILKERIAPRVFDRAAAEAFYQTYGPFDTRQLEQCLDTLLCTLPSNLHISVYLQHVKDQLIGG
jgi:transposase InsO family protein